MVQRYSGREGSGFRVREREMEAYRWMVPALLDFLNPELPNPET